MLSNLPKLSSISQGAKASIALFFATLITKGISYLTTPIFTRLLNPDEFGFVTIFYTWQNVIGIIAMFCLMNGVFNNGMVDYPHDRAKYSSSMLALSNVITLSCAAILIIIYPYINRFLEIDSTFLCLMFITFLVQPAYNFWAARERYELKWEKLVVWTVILALISPVVAILSIKYLPFKVVSARIFGAEVPLIIVYIFFYVKLLKGSNWHIDLKFWKQALLFNLPLIPHYLSSLLLNCSDTIMISNLVGYEKTAFYTVAYSISSIVAVLWTSVNASLIPFTYEQCKRNDYRSIARVTQNLMLAFAVVCMVVILLAPEIVAIMAPKQYLEAIYCIPPIIIGVYFQTQYYIYANIVFYHRKPIYIMFASVFATILNIGLNYWLIPIYGYLAAGYTTLLCYLVQAIFDYFAMRYVVRRKVYNMKIIICISITVVLGGCMCSLLYDKSCLRYCFIATIVLLSIFYRKKIVDIIRF